MSSWRLLRTGDFGRLFGSAAVSVVGDWLDYVAILVLVSSVWHYGASGLAVISVAVAVPSLGAPFVGVLADRLEPRVAIVIADLSRALITVGIATSPNLPVLAGLTAIRASFSTLFAPAQQRALKRAIAGDDLLRANSLNQAAQQLFKIIGPALGGLLITMMSPRAVIGINAGSFLISAALIIGLTNRAPANAAHSATATGYLAELGEGISFVRRTRVLRMVISTIAATVFLVFLYDSMSPLAVRGLGLSSENVGYFVAAVGVGGMAGALLIGQVAAKANPFHLMAGGQLVVGGMAAVMGVGVFAAVRLPAAVWIIVVLVLGLASAGVLVPFPSVIQQATPDQLLGRTWSVVGVVPSVLQVLAPPIAAALVPLLGVGRMFIVAGAGLAALAAVTWIRAARYPLPAGTPESQLGGISQYAEHGGEVKSMATISQLEAAGFDVATANKDQRVVLEGLSDEELQVLTSVKQRITDAADVEGHTSSGGDSSGGYFW